MVHCRKGTIVAVHTHTITGSNTSLTPIAPVTDQWRTKMEYMKKWRDGLVSDSEALAFLIDDLCDIMLKLRQDEERKAEERNNEIKA